MGKRKSRSAIRKLRAATKRKESLMKLINNINNININKIKEYNTFYMPLQGEYSDYCNSINEDEEEGKITLPPPVTVPPEIKETEGVK